MGTSAPRRKHGERTNLSTMTDQMPAGWYPDPAHQNLQRYWDGIQWTEHTAPLQTSDGGSDQSYGQAAQPAQSDYGAQLGFGQSAGGDGYGQAAPAQPGQQPYPQADYSQQPGSYGAGGAPSEAPKRNVGIVAGIVGGTAVLIVLLAIIGINLFGGNDEADPELLQGQDDDSPDGDRDEPIDSRGDEAVETNNFSPGDVISGEVPEDADWTGTMTLTEETAVIFDVRRDDDSSGLDATLTILDDGGIEIISNDDRPYQIDFLTESALNSYVAVTLAAGEYEVVVGSFMSISSGDFTMTTAALPTLEPGQESTLELEENQYGGYGVNITESGSYTLTVSVDPGDASVYVFDDGGITSFQQERGTDAELTVELRPGLHPTLVAEDHGRATTLSYTIESN